VMHEAGREDRLALAPVVALLSMSRSDNQDPSLKEMVKNNYLAI